MVRAGRQQPGAAGPRHDAQLGESILPGMSHREVLPEAEAAGRLEGGSVVEDASPHPGDPVQPLVTRRGSVTPRRAIEVGGVVEPSPAPGRAPGPDDLRLDRPVPELHVLLVGPHIVEIAQADHSAADEPDAVSPQGPLEPLHQGRLDDHVVVQEEHGRRGRPAEQELPLLRHAVSGHMAHHLHADAEHRQQPQHGLQFGAGGERAGTLGLVRDDDAERAMGLEGDADERHRKGAGAVDGGDQDIDLPRPLAHVGALARLRPRSVLVVRALPGLGDMLCAVPALRALRAALPHARITLLTLPEVMPVLALYPGLVDAFLAFPGFPGIPETAFDPAALPPFLARVQGEHHDLAVQLHGNGMLTNAFVQLLGARDTAGHFLPAVQRPPGDGLWLEYPGRGHEIRRLLGLVRFLGAPDDGEDLPLAPDPAHRAGVLDLLAGEGVRADRLAVVHAGASDPDRRWPASRFAAVAHSLAALGFDVVLTGSRHEGATTAAVLHAAGAGVHDLTGKTGLGTLAELLHLARVLVSNDTGVSHLAVATATPSVVVFSRPERERWAPLDSDLHRAVGPSVARPGATGPTLREPAVCPSADCTPTGRSGLGDRCLRDACRLASGVEHVEGPPTAAVLREVARLLQDLRTRRGLPDAVPSHARPA